jgi:hypothetical protein
MPPSSGYKIAKHIVACIAVDLQRLRYWWIVLAIIVNRICFVFIVVGRPLLLCFVYCVLFECVVYFV